MNHADNRVDELLSSTMQIVDHMEVDAPGHNQLAAVKSALAGLQGQSSAENRASMQAALADIERSMAQLQNSVNRDYRAEAGDDIQGYESLAIDEQQKNREAYHGKIDSKSLVKMQQNIEEIKRHLQ